jgi:uncharacterized protein YacL
MLILLLRTTFVLLSVLIGMTSGQHFYRNIPDWLLPNWFGAAMGFGVAITLIAAENAFRRHFTRSLVAFLIGLAAGLGLSWLLLSVLHAVIQDPNIYNNLDLPLALVTIYLVLIIVLKNTDHFRVVIPFVEFRAERLSGGTLVVDAASLADSRLVALVRAGLLPHRILVHRRVLMHCEAQATSTEPGTAARGRRALDGLSELRSIAGLRVEIDESEIPNASSLNELLVHLTRLENARLLVGEPEGVGIASAEGIVYIDLIGLSAALTPSVRAGEIITVRIDKQGEGKSQGVGFLSDGSMAIVSDAAQCIGQQIRCTVMRLHSTSNGRMVFAERVKEPEKDAGSGAPSPS